MINPGDTVWYEHVEATEQIKVRPAVVLQIVAGTVLVVVGQTRVPQNAYVGVRGKDFPPTRQAQLPNDVTYFDCGAIIIAPLEHIRSRMGKLPSRLFDEIKANCQLESSRELQRATEQGEQQRRHLAEVLRRHEETHSCNIDDIADQAGLARARLRSILSGAAWWTQDDLDRLASVLAIPPPALLAQDD